MKRNFFSAGFIIAALTLASCSKTDSSMQSPVSPISATTTLTSQARMSNSELANRLTISSYGFLQLTDSLVGQYTEFLKESSETSIAELNNSIGYHCQLESGSVSDNEVPVTHLKERYLFSQDGVIQIGDIVVRSVYNEGYLLAMHVSSLSPDNYSKLSSKLFDPSFMVKMNIGTEYEPSLQGFVMSNIGHDGTGDPVPPTPSARRRFIGYGEYHNTGGVACHRDYYFFWIKIPSATEYVYGPC